MSAETLRKAAALMRVRAEAADADDATTWGADVHVLLDIGDDTFKHAVTWHPAVALAVARWLDDVAAGWMWDDVDEDGYGVTDPDGFPLKYEESMDTHPVAIARAYLGSDA